MSQNDFQLQLLATEPKMLAFALKLTQNIDDAKDLVQETVYRSFKNRKRFEAGSNFRAWTMTIMKNIFINDYRKRTRRRAKMVHDYSDNQYFMNSGERTIENQGVSQINVEEITEIIKRLPEDLKIPFVMHYRGYRYEEIAQQVDIPLGTIKSRIHFARKQLKTWIKERFGTEKMEELLMVS